MIETLASWSAFAAAAEICLRLLAYASCAFTIGFSLLSVYAGRKFRVLAAQALQRQPRALPPVTMLKPIKGIDSRMRENLASFLSQDYPCFQVLFAIQDPQDPALPVLRQLKRDFPYADMEIIVSGNRIGSNPKINNIANAYAFAKYDTLLISDSDIHVARDFLRRTVAPLMDPRVGMVTSFYRSAGASGWGALLEALSVNAHFLPQALTAGNILGLRFAMGAAMLVRRSAFEAIGGFQALSDHLADDFILGRAIAQAGWRVEFSAALVDSVHGAPTIAEHIAHLARGAHTIRTCQPAGYAALLVLQGLALATLHMLLFGPTPAMAACWLAIAGARVATVAWLHLAYLDHPAILPQLPMVPLADLLQSCTWVCGFRSRAVLWRGEYYDLRRGGLLVPRQRLKPPLPIASPVP